MSTRRPKSVLDDNRYTAELSTGQLVIGVCILLMFGLGCFLLGVLIGKFDPTLKNGAQIAAGDPSKTRPSEVKIIEPPKQAQQPAGEAKPQPPAELHAPARVLANEATPAKPETAPVAAAESRPDQNLTEPEPAPATPTVGDSVHADAARNHLAPPDAQPKPVAPDEKVATAPSPATPEQHAKGPNPFAPKQDATNKLPASTPSKAASTAPSKPAPTATSKSPVAANSEGWKGFGVQIVAASRDRAEASLKALQSKTSYKGRVLPHAKGNLYRVVVGPYSDQTAAFKARDDLRARGFKDAFTLVLQ